MIPVSSDFAAVNVNLVKHPINVIAIEGYWREFVDRDTAVVGQYDWIVEGGIDDLVTTVSDLDGGANIGELAFRVQDVAGLITADFPNFVFEGHRITLRSGFVGMNQAAFATLFTGIINRVESANANLEYRFTCVSIRQELSKVIYTEGDDGQPTDQKHPRTLNGHPLDMLLAILQTEIGLDSASINLGRIQSLRDDIYSGIQMEFKITSPPVAREFIEAELCKPLGLYIWEDSRGLVSINSFYPQSSWTGVGYGGGVYGGPPPYGGSSSAAPFALVGHILDDTTPTTRDNIVVSPLCEQAELINQVVVRFDFPDEGGGDPFSISVQQDGASQDKYGLFGNQIIESHGLRSGFQGFSVAQLTSILLFLRYADKTLMLGASAKFTALWDACVLEPGDSVNVTHNGVPDRKTGTIGITNRRFEVLDRIYHFKTATVDFRLIDVDRLLSFHVARIAPNAQPDYLASTSEQKGRYLFLSSDTGLMSDGTMANTLS